MYITLSHRAFQRKIFRTLLTNFDAFSALNLCERASLNCTYGCQNGTNGTIGCFCPIGHTLASNNVDCEGKFSKAVKT